MSNEKPLGQAQLFEEVEAVISLPYNISLKTALSKGALEVEIFERNGRKPYIKMRYPKVNEASKDDSAL